MKKTLLEEKHEIEQNLLNCKQGSEAVTLLTIGKNLITKLSNT